MDNKKYFDQIIQIFKHEDFIDKEVLLEDQSFIIQGDILENLFFFFSSKDPPDYPSHDDLFIASLQKTTFSFVCFL